MARRGFVRRNAGKLALSAIITGAILWGLHAIGLKLWPTGVTFAHVKWWTVPAYFVLLAARSWFRATRWRFLLRKVNDTLPTVRLLSISWIGFAAILLFPFRLGEFVRPMLLREKGKVSGTAATGSVVAERVVDGLYLSIVLAIALIFVPHIEPMPETDIDLPGGGKVVISGQHIRASGFLMLAIFVVAFVVIAVFYFARSFAHKMTLMVFGIVSKKLAERLAQIPEKLADGLHFLGSGRDGLGFFLETSAYWIFNAGGMWLLAWGCGLAHADGSSITFGESCAMMGMLGIAVLIPGPPGLLGTFQAGIYAGMVMYFPIDVAKQNGASYVFLLYASQVVWLVLAAAFFMVRDRSMIKKAFDEPEPESENLAQPSA